MVWPAPIIAQQTREPWADGFVWMLDSDQRFVLLIVAIGCATVVTIAGIIVFGTVANLIHRRRAVHELKRDMLEQGFSADEIVKVMEPTPPSTAMDRFVELLGKHKRKC